MKYIYKYCTPKEYSDMYMSSDGQYLTGLWFENSQDNIKNGQDGIWKDLPIFADTAMWLNDYFIGRRPENSVK
ncbi:MAG: methylated-DNA--[protein]-cysteine S-methyltransferase, partial [Erysipelotrichia bacterium]|nr:methylated-DNA--[protein]-cysteine S-methyltransferase [Erysipelotrichia bacterium]